MFKFLLLFCGLSSPVSAQELVQVSHFATEGIKNWEVKKFKGETHYEIKELDGKKYLFANAKASASGLVRKITINLDKTPELNWSWRIDKLPKIENQKIKIGDDFPARIYVIISGGFTFWNTLAVNFVWANSEPKGSFWVNPFTKNAIMYAAESGPANLGRFISYKFNLKEVLKKTLSKDISQIDAIAVMTDADNSQLEVSAYYGEIFFN